MSPSRRYKISAVLDKTSQLCRVCQTGTANWGLSMSLLGRGWRYVTEGALTGNALMKRAGVSFEAKIHIFTYQYINTYFIYRRKNATSNGITALCRFSLQCRYMSLYHAFIGCATKTLTPQHMLKTDQIKIIRGAGDLRPCPLSRWR